MCDSYGERSLWAEVLHLAYLDLQGRANLNYTDAYYWVLSDAVHPTSFVWVCGVLYFDHIVIRKKLLENG